MPGQFTAISRPSSSVPFLPLNYGSPSSANNSNEIVRFNASPRPASAPPRTAIPNNPSSASQSPQLQKAPIAPEARPSLPFAEPKPALKGRFEAIPKTEPAIAPSPSGSVARGRNSSFSPRSTISPNKAKAIELKQQQIERAQARANNAPKSASPTPSPSSAEPQLNIPGEIGKQLIKRIPIVGPALSAAELAKNYLDQAKKDGRNPFLDPPGKRSPNSAAGDPNSWQNKLNKPVVTPEQIEAFKKQVQDAFKKYNPFQGKQNPKNPPKYDDPNDNPRPIPPVGALGQYLRVTYTFKTWDGVTGEGVRGGVGPFTGIQLIISPLGQRLFAMNFQDGPLTFATDIFQNEDPKYRTKFGIKSVRPWNPAEGGEFPAPSLDNLPSENPAWIPGAFPPPLGTPSPGAPKNRPSPAPKSPSSPAPSPQPPPRPGPKPKNPPNPNPSPKNPPNPAPGSPQSADPNVSPPGFGAPTKTTFPSTTQFTNINPKTGKPETPKPDPNNPPPPPPEPPMSCSDPCIAGLQQGQQKQDGDLNDLKKTLEEIKKHIGVGELPASFQLVTGDFPQTINNMCELSLFNSRNIDAVSGKYPIKIKVKKGDGTEPEITLENQSHALEEMFAAMLTVAEDADAAVNILARLAVESTSTRIAVQQGNSIITAIQKWLGFDVNPKAEKIKIGFTPTAAGADNVLQNDEMDAFLKPSEQNFVASELGEKMTFKTIIERILNSTEIARAALWHPVKINKDGTDNITGSSIKASKNVATKADKNTWEILMKTLKDAGFDVDEKDPPKAAKGGK